MELQFGTRVVTSDGESVGKIDQMFFSATDRVLQQVQLDGDNRIVSFGEFTAVDDEGQLIIGRGAAQVEGMQTANVAEHADLMPAERAYSDYTRDRAAVVDDAVVAAAPVQTQVVAVPEQAVRPDDDARTHALTEDALDASRGVTADTVIVTKDTEVHGSDDKKVGNVDEVVVDDKGGLQGVVVRAGFIFKHDVYVPAESFRTFNGDRVDTTFTADEATEWRRN